MKWQFTFRKLNYIGDYLPKSTKTLYLHANKQYSTSKVANDEALAPPRRDNAVNLIKS